MWSIAERCVGGCGRAFERPLFVFVYEDRGVGVMIGFAGSAGRRFACATGRRRERMESFVSARCFGRDWIALALAVVDGVGCGCTC